MKNQKMVELALKDAKRCAVEAGALIMGSARQGTEGLDVTDIMLARRRIGDVELFLDALKEQLQDE